MGGKFKHIDLEMFEPSWGSNIASVIIELEKLREKKLSGSAPPYIFFQIKNIFQFLESVGSARIEGNNTTLSEFAERVIDEDSTPSDEQLKEIWNIENAIEFIDENIKPKQDIDRKFISELHKKIVEGLSLPEKGEGSRNPGELRHINVKVANHTPPSVEKVKDYFDELLEFINKPVSNQFHLLKVAIVHHRMCWIHPFDNGNGRLVRMLTYAMLIKQGFQVKAGRILNPTAIFCIDRDKYYETLSIADSGRKEDVLKWCEYVLVGLKDEIEKIDRLLDIKYLKNSILIPSLKYSCDRELLTSKEYKILLYTINNETMTIKSSDLISILKIESPQQRSRVLRGLKDKKMLKPLKKNGREYTIYFTNNYLLRGVLKTLEENDFIASFLTHNNQDTRNKRNV